MLSEWEKAQIRLQEEKNAIDRERVTVDREKIKSDSRSEILRLIPWIIFLLVFCYFVLGIANISRTLEDLLLTIKVFANGFSKSGWLQIILNSFQVK